MILFLSIVGGWFVFGLLMAVLYIWDSVKEEGQNFDIEWRIFFFVILLPPFALWGYLGHLFESRKFKEKINKFCIRLFYKSNKEKDE